MGEPAELEQDTDKDLDDQQANVEIEDEVVVVLEGQEEVDHTDEPQKRKPKAIRDMRKRIKEQNREGTAKDKEIKLLKEQLAARNNPDITPAADEETDKPLSDTPPTLADCGFDTEKFETKYAQWNDAKLDQKLDERLGERDTRERNNTASQQNETLIEAHYQRASDLKVGDYEVTEDAAVAALGSKLVQSIQTTVDNSERLIYWLGKNPEEAAKLSVLFDANPGKATFTLGVLASKITLRPKNGKGAPEPDLSVGGGGGSGNATLKAKFLKKLAEASNDTDNPIAARRRVREAAKAQGIDLPFNTV